MELVFLIPASIAIVLWHLHKEKPGLIKTALPPTFGVLLLVIGAPMLFVGVMLGLYRIVGENFFKRVLFPIVIIIILFIFGCKLLQYLMEKDEKNRKINIVNNLPPSDYKIEQYLKEKYGENAPQLSPDSPLYWKATEYSKISTINNWRFSERARIEKEFDQQQQSPAFRNYLELFNVEKSSTAPERESESPPPISTEDESWLVREIQRKNSQPYVRHRRMDRYKK